MMSSSGWLMSWHHRGTNQKASRPFEEANSPETTAVLLAACCLFVGAWSLIRRLVAHPHIPFSLRRRRAVRGRPVEGARDRPGGKLAWLFGFPPSNTRGLALRSNACELLPSGKTVSHIRRAWVPLTFEARLAATTGLGVGPRKWEGHQQHRGTPLVAVEDPNHWGGNPIAIPWHGVWTA